MAYYRGSPDHPRTQSNAELAITQNLQWLRQHGQLKHTYITDAQLIIPRVGDDRDKYQTYPDIYFPQADLACYLDGPPHRHTKISMRDRQIDRDLEASGIPYLRFPYKPPLSNMRRREIVQQILDRLPKC